MRTICIIQRGANYFLAWLAAQDFDGRLAFLIILVFFPIVGTNLMILLHLLDVLSAEIAFKLAILVVSIWFAVVLLARRLK